MNSMINYTVHNSKTFYFTIEEKTLLKSHLNILIHMTINRLFPFFLNIILIFLNSPQIVVKYLNTFLF